MDRRCKDLRELTVQKEQELQSLREHHANQLEEALKDARTEIVAERRKFRDLRNDFEYNLTLLEQRDAELARYDTVFAELRQTVQNLVAEKSELKIEIDRLNQVVSTHNEKEEQLKNYYLQRIEEHRRQLDAYRQVKDREVAGDRAECARLQKELQAKLVNVQGELCVDRERMEAQYDCLLRRQEEELRGRIAELTTSLIERDGQLRELGKELQAAKTSAECSQREAEEKQEEAARAEQGGLENERRLLERLNTQELKVVDSETRLASTEARLKALQGEAARKLADADRNLREKERALVATREACRNLERDMEQLSDTFRGQLEVALEASRREQEVHLATMEEKRLEAERLESQLLQEKKAAKTREAELVKEGIVKDAQIQALQEGVNRLQSQLRSRDADVEKFKQELILGAERETALQQEKAQAALDWSRKLEEAEREAYSRHEDVITQLSKSRDKAIAEYKQLQTELSAQAELLKCLQTERDAAVAKLEKHHQFSPRSSALDASSELEQKNIELEQRNHELKAVIQEMRREMEQCLSTDPAKMADGPLRVKGALSRVSDAPYSAQYVGYLERELAEMKAEKRKMAERLEELVAHRKPPTPPPPSLLPSPAKTSSTDSRHRAHLIALSDTIATLQKEKCGLELEVMQLKGREEQLQGTVRLCQEEIHRSRALAVPPSKVHHKLLRATQVIIALVAEKESLLKESQWLKNELQALHQQLASHGADKQPAAAHQPVQNGVPPTIASTPRGSTQSSSLPHPKSSQPTAGTEVFIRAPPTTALAPPTTMSDIPTAALAPPMITVSTHVDAPPTITSTETPPFVVPPPHQQSVFTLPSSLPPPTNHSSPVPPLSLLNESSDFEQQHNNLERLLCQLGHDESHAPSSCRSSPRHPPALPLWEEEGLVPSRGEEVGVALSQGEEGIGVQGVGVRPLPKHTATTNKGTTKLQGRRLVHSKPVKIRNYNNRS